MADQWEQYEVKGNDDWEQYATKSTPTNSNMPSASSIAIAGGATALAGYGMKKLIEPFPIASSNKKILTGMQKDLGIEGTNFNRVPQKISENISSLKQEASSTVKNLGFNLKNIDTQSLNPQANDLANHIAKSAPEFNKSLSDGYRKSIDAISTLSEEKGFNFSNKNFEADVIDKTIEKLSKSGTNPEELKFLQNAKQTLGKQSTIVDPSGKPLGTNLSVKNANGIVSKIIEQDPFGKPSAILRETWGEFLENNAPKEVKPYIQSLNNQFKPAVTVRNLISKFIDPKTRELDTSRFSKYISDYAKGKRSQDVEAAIKFLTKGNDLVPAMEGVGEKFSVIDKIRSQRTELIKQMQGLQNTASENVKSLSKKLSNAKTVLSRYENAKGRIANRMSLGTRPLLKAMGVPLRAIGPIGMLNQAVRLGTDPQAALAEMLGSPSVPPKGTPERAMFEFQALQALHGGEDLMQ